MIHGIFEGTQSHFDIFETIFAVNPNMSIKDCVKMTNALEHKTMTSSRLWTYTHPGVAQWARIYKAQQREKRRQK